MARTKSSSNKQQYNLGQPIKEPWEVDFEQSLAKYGPTASTATIYPHAVHRGFEADGESEPLIRRYDAFDENEAHRETLARSLCERLMIPPENSKYFSPEDLWKEHDRLNRRKEFTWDEEASWEQSDSEDEDLQDTSAAVAAPSNVPKGLVGEDDIEGADELADMMRLPTPPNDVEVASDFADLFEGDLASQTSSESEELSPETPATSPVPETKEELKEKYLDLPLALTGEDHDTTITSDLTFIRSSLDFLATSTTEITSISTNFSNGGCAVAFSGRPRATAGGEDSACSPDGATWTLDIKESGRPSMGLTSGLENFQSLSESLEWKQNSLAAVVREQHDGHLLVVVVGERYGAPESSINTLETLESFLVEVHNARTQQDFPDAHGAIATMLQDSCTNLVQAGILHDPTGEMLANIARKAQKIAAAIGSLTACPPRQSLKRGRETMESEEDEEEDDGRPVKRVK